MIWSKEFLGTDFYHILHWFLVYSILGWLVESIYMSFCNRKITNRGFVSGPFCPIYGVGALTVYFLLQPYRKSYLALYFLGAVIATLIEFLVARLMLRVFGEVWWDYREKPFNYKGILCLESTIAWGFYTVFLFLFLQKLVERIVNSYSYAWGVKAGALVFGYFLLDFTVNLFRAKKDEISEKCRWIRAWW